MNTGTHRYEDRLLDFAYGELPAAEARSIEAHVKGCARCTGALREIEGVRRQMSQLAPEPAPDAGLDSLLAYAEQAARRSQAGPAPARGIRRWIFGAVGAASLAAVLVVVGVVVNRPELAPASPASVQRDEALQQLQSQAAPPPVAATSPATPAADPVATVEQPLAREKAKDKALEEAAGQAEDDRYEEPRRAAEAAKHAAPEPKVGKAVGNKYVQQVDVSGASTADRKVADRNDARYRESGHDAPDQMQNMVPGRGTRPVLPTTSAPSFAQKTAPQPADGEMMLPAETKGGSRPSKKSASVAKKPSQVPMAGSGGGIGTVLRKPAGGSSSKTGAAADEDFGSLFGGGSTSGGAKESGSAGVVRPMKPAGPAQDGIGRAQLDSQLQAKQRAQAETTRRDEEAQKAERSKLAVMKDQEAPIDLAKKSVATREPSPAPTPAPAAAAPGAAPAASRSRGGDAVAMNEPPPAQAQAPMPISSGPSSRKAAEAPPPPKVRTENAQELFMSATRARPGSAEEIDGLMRAIGAGLGGQYRIDALQRLCTRLEDQGDERAFSYCNAWASADPASVVANKRAREAETRWGMRKAKASKKAADPAAADSLEAPAKADTQQKATSY